MSNFRGRGFSNQRKFGNDRGRKRYFHVDEQPNKQTFRLDEESIERSPKKYRNNDTKRFRSDDAQCKTEEKNDESQDFNEILMYYEKVLNSLKQGITIENKDVFANNVLEQTNGYEVDLSCNGISSHCIELLLSQCNDDTIFFRFMNAFAERISQACTNANASHVTEILIYFSLQSMEDWYSVLESDKNPERQKLVSEAMVWLSTFGEFCIENFKLCIQNIYACHVLTTLIQALGGHYSNEKIYESKKTRIYKTQFQERYFGSEDFKKSKLPIKYDKIPKFFSKLLKKLSEVFINQENIKEIVCESSSATVVEALLSVLKERQPKYCKKVVTAIATQLLAERNSDGTPFAFLHKNSSYVVEKLFESALEEQQKELWFQYFASCLPHLITHPVGNFVVQRLFDVVASKELFAEMSEEAGKYFNEILDSHCFGVFLSIAAACNRFKIQQAQFMQYMMQCLQCHEPEDRQLHFIPLLLGLNKYRFLETSESNAEPYHTEICLQGSLIAQAILRFHKPIKAVKSIFHMKPDNLASLASHIQGCHVLTCFFESTNNVGEKNKDKLINHLKSVLPAIASDRSGSLTLSRMWVLFTLKQKGLVAQELSNHVRLLQASKSASIILKKFGVFHYKNNFEHWKAMQINFSKPQIKVKTM